MKEAYISKDKLELKLSEEELYVNPKIYQVLRALLEEQKPVKVLTIDEVYRLINPMCDFLEKNELEFYANIFRERTERFIQGKC